MGQTIVIKRKTAKKKTPKTSTKVATVKKAKKVGK